MRTFTTILPFAAIVASVSVSVSARKWVITVGTTLASNGSDFDASSVFTPQTVTAALGDQVVFNFTQGTHSVVRSAFDQPCVPISQIDSSINGFNTGLRPAGNFQAITQFPVDIDASVINQTLWFFDEKTCGNGGVGAINVNDSSSQPFNAFVRNAVRLFGPHANDTANATSSSDSASPSGTDTADPNAPTDTDTGAAGRTTVGAVGVALVVAAACSLVL